MYHEDEFWKDKSDLWIYGNVSREEKLAVNFVSLTGKNLTWKKILVSTKENLLTLEYFFRTLKINQWLTATQWEYIKEKQLSLSKNRELCGVLTCLSPTLYSVPPL